MTRWCVLGAPSILRCACPEVTNAAVLPCLRACGCQCSCWLPRDGAALVGNQTALPSAFIAPPRAAAAPVVRPQNQRCSCRSYSRSRKHLQPCSRQMNGLWFSGANLRGKRGGGGANRPTGIPVEANQLGYLVSRWPPPEPRWLQMTSESTKYSAPSCRCTGRSSRCDPARLLSMRWQWFESSRRHKKWCAMGLVI